MRWLVLFSLMLIAAGVAWYSAAVFIPMLKARAGQPGLAARLRSTITAPLSRGS